MREMKFKTNILRQQQIGFEACKLILNDLSPRAVSEPMNRLNEHEVSHIPFFAHSPFFAIYCMKFISASKNTHSKNSCSTRSKSERKVCSPAYCNLIHYTLLFFCREATDLLDDLLFSYNEYGFFLA